MSTDRRLQGGRRQRGLTLVELILTIIVVSVASAGVLGVLTLTTKNSADPQLRKQAMAVAEALMEEVQAMPFTACDPDAYNALTSACTTTEVTSPGGPEAGEIRGDFTTPRDNVNDYNGLTITGGATDLNNSGSVTVPAGYTAQITVVEDATLGAGLAPVPGTAALLITVTVTYGGGSITLQGYRTQYSPVPQ